MIGWLRDLGLEHARIAVAHGPRAPREAMLVSARGALPLGSTIRGATAARGAAMIFDEEALAVAADEVARIEPGAAAGCDAVSDFGDPGIARLRVLLSIPVVGSGEAGLQKAAAGSRRFGIATTTPDLAGTAGGQRPHPRPGSGLLRRACVHGQPDRPCGGSGGPGRCTRPRRQRLHDARWSGTRRHRGRPLSASAVPLRHHFAAAIIEPVPAAVRAVVRWPATFPR